MREAGIQILAEMPISSQRKERTNAKGLGQNNSWYVGETSRRLVWLEARE